MIRIGINTFDNSIYVDNELLNFISTLLMDYELEEDVLTTIVFGNKEYLAKTITCVITGHAFYYDFVPVPAYPLFTAIYHVNSLCGPL